MKKYFLFLIDTFLEIIDFYFDNIFLQIKNLFFFNL
jgi:hypothetical protein